MSGHSKFANIKHKKEKNDAKKGKIFTVIGRELVMAVKAGGPDPNNNSKLRDVIAKGYKFKPWGAINMGKNITKWAGWIGAGIGVALELYGWYKPVSYTDVTLPTNREAVSYADLTVPTNREE